MTRARRRARPYVRAMRSDRGSAVVEFALVVPLVLLIALGVLQVALFLHIRTTLTAAAAEGARVAALSGSTPLTGERRTRSVLSDALADDVVESVRADRAVVSGVRVAVVTVEARVPLLGLLGPSGLQVRGHAVVEPEQ